MSKFWKVGGKPVSPIVWGIAAAGIFYAIKKWSDRRIETMWSRVPIGPLGTTPASSTITVPPGKRWLVTLKNGDTTQMTSAQLQNAIEAKGVRYYREIKTTKV